MGISIGASISVVDEKRFHELAYRVLGITYEIHNEFGRLLHEDVYKRLVQRRCESTGLVPAHREVEITVSFESFRKSYFVDLLVADGVLVEAKTASSLTATHESQTLNYLLLTGLQHGLLINFRTSEVGKRYVSTTLTYDEQRRFRVDDSMFLPRCSAEERVHEHFLKLVADWGCFLQTGLYRDAIVHFLGGPEFAFRRIPIYDGTGQTGEHEAVLVSDQSGLAITALKRRRQAMREQIKRFLSHTRLAGMHWINLNGHTVEVETV